MHLLCDVICKVEDEVSIIDMILQQLLPYHIHYGQMRIVNIGLMNDIIQIRKKLQHILSTIGDSEYQIKIYQVYLSRFEIAKHLIQILSDDVNISTINEFHILQFTTEFLQLHQTIVDLKIQIGFRIIILQSRPHQRIGILQKIHEAIRDRIIRFTEYIINQFCGIDNMEELRPCLIFQSIGRSRQEVIDLLHDILHGTIGYINTGHIRDNELIQRLNKFCIELFSFLGLL